MPAGQQDDPAGTARPDTNVDLRLRLADRTPEQTTAFVSTIGVELHFFGDGPVTVRVVPGAPDDSGLLFRMSMRGPETPMPPLATELVDEQGVALLGAWLESLR